MINSWIHVNISKNEQNAKTEEEDQVHIGVIS